LETTTITVNGAEAETGCWIAGHHGQYATDQLADIAETFGWQAESWLNDPRAVRQQANLCDDEGIPHDYWELHAQNGDDILDWLIAHTPDGAWYWSDGELFLAGRPGESDGWL